MAEIKGHDAIVKLHFKYTLSVLLYAMPPSSSIANRQALPFQRKNILCQLTIPLVHSKGNQWAARTQQLLAHKPVCEFSPGRLNAPVAMTQETNNHCGHGFTSAKGCTTRSTVQNGLAVTHFAAYTGPF
eukprot:1043197-Pelagomonas_calceolata.AAC.1